jgi:hypothetical protein
MIASEPDGIWLLPFGEDLAATSAVASQIESDG